jgi:hypothetical protein
MYQIDTSFDVRSDTPPGRDPDKYSPTLRRYHQLLWSKPLPSGRRFDLDRSQSGVYLYHRSEAGEFFLASDGIIHTYVEHFPWLAARFSASERADFEHRASTIAGYTIFPGDKRSKGMTINGARGFDARIRDRIDLTLECIRRHYAGIDSPLARTLDRYADFFALFDDFAGYIRFFLLDDLVSADYSTVRFLLDFDEFRSTDPRPQTVPDYIRYRHGALQFVAARSARIEDVARSLDDPLPEVRFERTLPARLTFDAADLEAAMQAFGVPPENAQAVRDFVTARQYSEFYIPPSRSYLGLRHVGSRRVDTVHFGYVEYWAEAGKRTWIGLPRNNFRQ